MTQEATAVTNQPLNLISKLSLYSKKLASGLETIGEGFYLIYRHGLYKDPNNPVNTRYVQYFCRRLCEVFNIEVEVHGTIPREPALWVSNHISWLDVAVLGSGARIFFLAKAEVERWPILGKLAKGGGTLFIKRGSGDSIRIREQITEFLKQDIPVLFFPEATTTDGSKVKKVHGRLLGAAIEAQRPVQVCVICYVNQNGELDLVAPFIGEMTFAEHVQRVLEMPKVTAHLMTLPAISVEGHTVDSLTKEVDRQMRAGLAKLQQKVLTVLPETAEST
ncbi:lysophospholipid acyltransferase family protein [Acinetobacter vivianii]|uniref:Lysophospholipid acyltransferase family protein n=1 Tax=Acinetobacter vivianii TaxID=1776742 RepID=A0AAJ6NK00_9GAMM|nr:MULTISPECIES: lysophospholipid acyltransferase family protein [Acinetobacter]KYQ82739.1 acyltransferase [Acinetobacter sp. NRRL B-65365]MEB6480126.1 1-acyl-sn-glycerol-3-phosphate acyltransferase [Acinetobacter vivianii]MEB6658113.1 1-acyl-sn-glycerol-3-phosphate acyltransferase [Acinetobacter vivianii]MEB6667089.1 1-acyl-sn-glycerol-3-phosphate acyltransferase [Acinetobacter vivianii]WDZ51708.1 lysophospholipid acyltransferase family protein [Acinetobacter vivianii]